MKKIQDYKDLGVRELKVTNKEAVAVNPYDDSVNPIRLLDGKDRATQYVTDLINKMEAFDSLNLPPLPCPSVKDGTYEIGRFEEMDNCWVINDESDDTDYETSTVIQLKKGDETLVLSEQVEETEPEDEINLARIDFVNCNTDYDYTICEWVDVSNQILVAEYAITDFDPLDYKDEPKPEIKITPVVMTVKGFQELRDKWFSEF